MKNSNISKTLLTLSTLGLIACSGGGGGGGGGQNPRVCKGDDFSVQAADQSNSSTLFGMLEQIPSRDIDLNESTIRYLITFKPGTSQQVVSNLLGLNFENYLTNVSVAFAQFHYGDPQIARLLLNPLVRGVELETHAYVSQGVPGIPLPIDPPQDPPEDPPEDPRDPGDTYRGSNAMPNGIARVKTNEAWLNAKFRGKEIRIGILDTGIDRDHEDIEDNRDSSNTVEGRNFTDSGSGANDYEDRHSHGTHVAGSACARDNDWGVVGVAPNCKLFAYKVLGDDGSGQSSWIINGINQAIADRMDVINLSLGYDGNGTTAYEQAFRSAESAGIVAVAAAGNNAQEGNRRHYPGSSQYTLSVAALDTANRRASFSHFSSDVDISAPGTGVRSTTPGNRYESKQGTSMASPHVAGVAALAVEYHGKIPAVQLKNLLKCTATDLGPAGRDDEYGAGIVDAQKVTSTAVCDENGGEDYSHEVVGFSATRVSDRTEEGVLVKIDLDDLDNSGEMNITYDLVIKDTSNNVQAIHEMRTDTNGQDEAMIKGYNCQGLRLTIENFRRNGVTNLRVKGRKNEQI